MQTKQNYKEERTDLIVGILVIVAVMALFVLMISTIGRNMRKYTEVRYSGQITYDGTAQRGKQQTFTYAPARPVADGEQVIWKVNGEQVFEGVYAQDQPISFDYTPDQSGRLEICAQAGNNIQTAVLDVERPRLTLTLPDYTVVYGEPLPQLSPNVTGFVDEEEQTNFCYDAKCTIGCDKPDVGVYSIRTEAPCEYLDYETECSFGTLTVLPRELAVVNDFVKTYDSTNYIQSPDIRLEGVVDGDDVYAQCDRLYFDNKNVGMGKTVLLGSIELLGEDGDNYFLPDFGTGTIAPRGIVLEGLSVKDKYFDGTTKAQLNSAGTLNGVCEGDSVAIGNISVSFDEAGVGKHNVITQNITLIGADKSNYTVVGVKTNQAEILQTEQNFWDKLLNREPVSPTAVGVGR